MNIGPSTGGSPCFARLGGVGALPANAAAEGLGSSATSAGSGGLGGGTATAKAAASAALRASSAADAGPGRSRFRPGRIQRFLDSGLLSISSSCFLIMNRTKGQCNEIPHRKTKLQTQLDRKKWKYVQDVSIGRKPASYDLRRRPSVLAMMSG